MEKQKKPVFYGWTNVTILFFMYMFTIGFVYYPYSVIFPVMIEDMGWSRGSASFAFTLNAVLSGLLGPVLAISIAKFGTKRTMVFGLLCWLVPLVLLGTIVNSILLWTICWGVVAAIGISFGTLVPIQANIMMWFNNKRGTAIGIVMTGSAIGGFIAQPAYTWLISTTESWRSGWLAGGFFVILSLIISAFIKEKPGDIGQHPDGIDPDTDHGFSEKMSKKSKIYRSEINWPLKEAFRKSSTWFLVACILGFMMSFFLIASHGVLHFTDIGYTRMQAASIMGFIIFGSGVARFPMGALADNIEPRWIISASLFIMMVSLIGLWKAPSMGFLLFVGPCFGFSYGTLLVMQPAIIGNYFGAESFAKIYGFMSPIIVSITAFVPFAAGIIADRTGSYDLAFITISVVVFFSFLSALMLKPPVATFENTKPAENAGN
ncbi:MAG: MFS transporter [Desulfobacterales bacterium]|jgi:MFS family permease|nr:MFS transporter [Desulfobacteraceae bacterium]MBT4364718.1 MFS transporter [Desulfobacteraceae bacterium]MBT7086947.1 MFS transporter [Desulfobacterales bacterium]MBT7697349.1 MFS transporter [Desulfobacterales bacterium]